MSIAVIYGGSRSQGNAEILTKTVIHDLNVKEIYLKEYRMEPITDGRHDVEGFQEVADDYDKVIDQMLSHDIIIFSTPIYWYSMTGTMKNFIDRWSQTLRDSNRPYFKEQLSKKKAYVIAVGGDQPSIKGLPMIQQFQYIFDFVGISFEGYIIGHGNKPGDILNDEKALIEAEQLRKKLG
ncbi:multimeric flavodoxin WrbA [Cytobacillus horneckiae]|uniref:Flavodoxin family protein n=1 Tax=Cytobacillus horneckiae TaxID=549687 RepID=A0A2N0ZEU1_9BACI|nr:flavodoxin family protein [Cytobacillus horneckiae]MBN6889461.1 flavodoxin family protein [Cytobacillus horneckiae]MCM3176854.1 flavodoxin family protein [Cytobacillus horneckiae]MEC1156696.1 flavodoxin family protein [Cytobacillus horneckiae]MED2939083.1 flavodoxin family protein [Cytobacillus horneckiae]PKG28029.1 flavodoxin family protein [Cytobacillus horneckiae]